ncbi:MAG: hypothetical protein IPI48_14675 [bacterium]|nr:hypothetical protein [bacterium]
MSMQSGFRPTAARRRQRHPISKIEARKLELSREPFSLRRCLGDAVGALSPRAHQKGIELVYGVPPELPDCLVGDPIRLRQIVINLVGNAISSPTTERSR